MICTTDLDLIGKQRPFNLFIFLAFCIFSHCFLSFFLINHNFINKVPNRDDKLYIF